MAQGEIRGYKVQARSSDVFGRVLCNTRNHHFVVDGPVQNGCPGEAVTPAELFLAGIAACGVELVQAIGRDQQLAPRVSVEIEGALASSMYSLARDGGDPSGTGDWAMTLVRQEGPNAIVLRLPSAAIAPGARRLEVRTAEGGLPIGQDSIA